MHRLLAREADVVGDTAASTDPVEDEAPTCGTAAAERRVEAGGVPEDGERQTHTRGRQGAAWRTDAEGHVETPASAHSASWIADEHAPNLLVWRRRGRSCCFLYGSCWRSAHFQLFARSFPSVTEKRIREIALRG